VSEAKALSGEPSSAPPGPARQRDGSSEAHILLIEPRGTRNTGQAAESDFTAIEQTI
jgi:hypothetical protein